MMIKCSCVWVSGLRGAHVSWLVLPSTPGSCILHASLTICLDSALVRPRLASLNHRLWANCGM